MRHFLDIKDITVHDLQKILDVSLLIKNGETKYNNALSGMSLGMVFQKPSTRTRISFELAAMQLGCHAVTLNYADTHLGKGETISDTAQVFSRYFNAVMLRLYSHDDLITFTNTASIPIINGLTDSSHPCQVLAGVMAMIEHTGSIHGKTLAWFGDCNNVLNSYIELAEKLEFTIKVASPDSINHSGIVCSKDALEIAKNADVLITDTWVSMGDDKNKDISRYLPYQVNENLMKAAKPDALFSHCLPAYRGKEVTDCVIDSKNSIVWDEAENRLHVQKGILLYCFEII